MGFLKKNDKNDAVHQKSAISEKLQKLIFISEFSESFSPPEGRPENSHYSKNLNKNTVLQSGICKVRENHASQNSLAL